METADTTSRDAGAPESPTTAPAAFQNGKPLCVEPDLAFIRALGRQGGDSLKNCFQCGTCSAACELSPDPRPFPRKEMAWAVWGMKDRLLKDPDVWLCHQCNDCSTRCPRGARPGDVLAAVRQQCVTEYAVPRFVAKWANDPYWVPFLLGIPIAILTAVLCIGNSLGAPNASPERIIYPFCNKLPHWLLNSSFGLVSVLVLLVVVAGVTRFWRAMKAADARDGVGAAPPGKSLPASIVTVLWSTIAHDKFAKCTKTHLRSFSHMSVVFGFLALCLVTTWVITAKYNPLVPDGLIYPFGFFHPWKILANLGGAAILAGCLWMIVDRLRSNEHSGVFADWVLIATLILVVITGFASEVLHFVRLEPHRHLAYFTHLIFVLALLMYLPYSKLAHIFYRTTALVYAEHSGRNGKDTARTVAEEEA